MLGISVVKRSRRLVAIAIQSDGGVIKIIWSVELVARHGSLSIIERPSYQITPPVNGFAVSLVFDLKVLPR
jgi:hypothetical protein